MTCGAARRLGWGRGDPVVTSVERVRALAHVAQCESCRRFTSDMAMMASLIGSAAPGPEAPAHLTQRLRSRIAAARERRRKVRWTVGVIALAAAALLTLVRPVNRPGSEPVVEHLAELLAAPGIESSDDREVANWLEARTPLQVHVPTFGDARLTGATIAQIDGAPSVVVRFQVGNQYAVYTISGLTPPGEAEHSATLLTTRVGPIAVVEWRTMHEHHRWVGAIDLDHLTSLAKRCAEQARSAMNSRS